MLAQNFKSAADLSLTEPQVSALQKTLVLLETGKLRHVPAADIQDDLSPHDAIFGGGFNMDRWLGSHPCGTVGCIGGTAELIGKVKFNVWASDNLYKLFHPDWKVTGSWTGITPAQAATALRSYLTTGDARWDLAVA